MWNSTEELLDWMLEAMAIEPKLKRAKQRSRIWITLLADGALIQMANRPDTSVDDQRAVLSELRSRVDKLSAAAKNLEARLQKE